LVVVVQSWIQHKGEQHSWGPCVVDEAEQVVHDAIAVAEAAVDIAAAEAAAVVVAVGTAALVLVVVGM
jgi:hypothetical protein